MRLALEDPGPATRICTSASTWTSSIPDIAPGVGTTVPGGPSYREAQLCMEMIADTGRWARSTSWS